MACTANAGVWWYRKLGAVDMCSTSISCVRFGMLACWHAATPTKENPSCARINGRTHLGRAAAADVTVDVGPADIALALGTQPARVMRREGGG